MKKFTDTRAIFLLVFLLTSASLRGQDYVVTQKGDTLKGNVKPQTFGPNSKVQVTNSDKAKTNFTLFQIRAFSFKNEIYQPVKGPNGYCFMKLKKAGYLSLYQFQLTNQTTFDGLYLTKMDGTGMEVPNLGFKKAMSKFLQDCPTVTDKIEKGDLGKRNIDGIMDEFNECVKSKTVDHTKLITQREDQTKKISAWDSLEEKLKSISEFDGKANALEMITDIKGKLSRGEKVPNFLTEGLKGILNPTELKGDLENALKELN